MDEVRKALTIAVVNVAASQAPWIAARFFADATDNAPICSILAQEVVSPCPPDQMQIHGNEDGTTLFRLITKNGDSVVFAHVDADRLDYEAHVRRVQSRLGDKISRYAVSYSQSISGSTFSRLFSPFFYHLPTVQGDAVRRSADYHVRGYWDQKHKAGINDRRLTTGKIGLIYSVPFLGAVNLAPDQSKMICPLGEQGAAIKLDGVVGSDTRGGVVIGSRASRNDGPVLYGPYLRVPAGHYECRIHVRGRETTEGSMSFSLDVVGDLGDTIFEKWSGEVPLLQGEVTEICARFSVTRIMSSSQLETRLWTDHDGEFVLQEYVLVSVT